MALAVVLSFLLLLRPTSSQWISYPTAGLATLTHYDLPRDYIASCGCVPGSTHYPTAALSQLAYGSNASYGPACGKCFKLTLLNPVVADPPFKPPVTKSVVVKVTDLCPFAKGGWCGGTSSKPNSAGAFLNFDLAFPSQAIPADFFPSNETLTLEFGMSHMNLCPACLTGPADVTLLRLAASRHWGLVPVALRIRWTVQIMPALHTLNKMASRQIRVALMLSIYRAFYQ
ncbi:hypothetical protein AX17_004003 [Amanita inopinata Kibby_2008]|nr:hypothetical protein AX17_004003 [Amanita inopinata Kibby_2008]